MIFYIALASYLSLTDINQDIVRPYEDSVSKFKYEKLISNVEHLKTQLRMMKALVSLKDIEIDLLKNSDRSNKTLITDNKNQVIEEKQQGWEPIEGVTFKTYKGKFFEIDIPKLVERIKRSLSNNNLSK